MWNTMAEIDRDEIVFIRTLRFVQLNISIATMMLLKTNQTNVCRKIIRYIGSVVLHFHFILDMGFV